MATRRRLLLATLGARAVPAALVAQAVPLAQAQDAPRSVQLSGQMGRMALLLVDGQPLTLAVGETRHGVTLEALDAEGALVQWGGRRSRLLAGAAPASVGADERSTGGGRSIVLTMGPGGHFMAQGTVNGRSQRFMVDTGATTVALGRADAERLGLDWRRGEPVAMNTAGGVVRGHRVSLAAVAVGEVTVAHVEAVVMPAAMPFALLGNSFLSRFQMRRENDVMRLELR
jgi:aspartyl protease family protein